IFAPEPEPEEPVEPEDPGVEPEDPGVDPGPTPEEIIEFMDGVGDLSDVGPAEPIHGSRHMSAELRGNAAVGDVDGVSIREEEKKKNAAAVKKDDVWFLR